MVLSFSSKMPHMVVPTKGGGFSCDNNCSNWKSIGLCSHSVAVAESNGKLEEFIMGVKRKKKIPNMTALATSTMPKGRGRKGSIPPHTRKSTRAAESCTRVSMNVGTQVVSGNIGTASTHATPNVPTCVGDRIQDLYSSPLPPNPWNHPYPLVPCRPSYSPPFTPPYFPPSYLVPHSLLCTLHPCTLLPVTLLPKTHSLLVLLEEIYLSVLGAKIDMKRMPSHQMTCA